jgi:hypothetical protein
MILNYIQPGAAGVMSDHGFWFLQTDAGMSKNYPAQIFQLALGGHIMAKVVTMETFEGHSIETIYRFENTQDAFSRFEVLVDENVNKIDEDLKSFSMILFNEVKKAAKAYHRTF